MESFVTDDGERIFVRATGDGPPMVLLHEWASSHAVWEPLARGLSRRFTVHRWDARGHGGRPPSGREPPTVGRMARDLLALMDAYALDRPVVVAHSMGALTLWEFIGRFGCDRLGPLVIIDQSPRIVTNDAWDLGIYGDWPAERDAAFVQAMRRDFADTVVKLVAYGRNQRARERYEAGSKGFERLRRALAALDSEPLVAIWESLAAADFRPVLHRISVPTLLVYASDSNYYGVETGLFVRRSIPAAKLLIYDGADHSPHLARPERFVADVLEFCGYGVAGE